MQFQEFIPLSRYSSFRTGGAARYFFAPRDEAELRDAVAFWGDRPLFVLGGGTNVIFHEEGFQGLVLHLAERRIEVEGDKVIVTAGTEMQELLTRLADEGLSGLEWAGGLPGTVGGAVRGNAGAFGGEMKDVVREVRSFDRTSGCERVRSADACQFRYRSSIFKHLGSREIILSVVLQLRKGDPAAIRKAIQEKITYRRMRHPMEYPNSGSIFKNVPLEQFPSDTRDRFRDVVKHDPFPVVPAAHLIAAAGLRGVSCGGAMVSPKHPNFIVNVLAAHPEEVRALVALVRAQVHEQFGVMLEPEVLFLPPQ
ncbi:UDP-N-acetylmuramate dehydrogenase [Candidatus Parcubacteria bacterium]|nr:MAG: UDP-N-acetylmuramate dehydrogenase [Candidatus Parcubacteria bacterium]